MLDISQLVGAPHLGISGLLEILVETLRQAVQTKREAVPLVSVFLRSGHSLHGYAVGFSTTPEAKTLIFANLPTDAGTPKDLSYILLSQIDSVTVQDAISTIDHLSDGVVATPLSGDSSVQRLSSELQTLTQEINSIKGMKITTEIADLGQDPNSQTIDGLRHVVRDWSVVVRKLASDDLRRQAFEAKPIKFLFEVRNDATVEFSEGLCHISIRSGKRGVERPTRTAIQSTIEELL